MSKIGGTTPYDFIKRCLSLLFTNKFAERYSWYGAKKKEIFGKLHLANVLLGKLLLLGPFYDRLQLFSLPIDSCVTNCQLTSCFVLTG